MRSCLASDDGSTGEWRHFSPCEAVVEMSTHQRLLVASFARTFPKQNDVSVAMAKSPQSLSPVFLWLVSRSLNRGMFGLEQMGYQELRIRVDMIAH